MKDRRKAKKVLINFKVTEREKKELIKKQHEAGFTTLTGYLLFVGVVV